MSKPREVTVPSEQYKPRRQRSTVPRHSVMKRAGSKKRSARWPSSASTKLGSRAVAVK